MTNEEKNYYLESLKEQFGEEVANKIVKLQKNCDNYLIKFKKEVNKLLDPYGYEVLCGVAYKEKDK